MSAKRVSSSTVATDLASYRGDPDFMASLARGLAIIRAFSGGTGRRTIGTLARATGLSRAAVRRCLYTLHRLGYVGLDERGHYTLRPAILSLGYAFLSSSSLAATARPLLDQVSERVHESCSMAVLDGEAIVYLARSAASRRIMSIDLGVGSRLPAWCTSMGRVLLAALPQAEQDDYLARVAPIAYTAHTVIKRERLKSMLAEVARSGYAVVDEELELGLRSMAVPVRDLAGQVVAALNVSAHASRVSIAELKRKCLAPLSEAASELSHALPA